jgi:uroporphyrinogen-III decarboxylase
VIPKQNPITAISMLNPGHDTTPMSPQACYQFVTEAVKSLQERARNQ